MNKYVEHIEELLYLHDCVIVPGLGGFNMRLFRRNHQREDGNDYSSRQKSRVQQTPETE